MRHVSSLPRSFAAALLATLPMLAWAGGDGLKLGADSDVWPRWQASLSVVNVPLGAAVLDGNQLQLGAARLAGDRYFDIGRIGDGGGLRATSALLLGSRSLALGAPVAYGNSALLLRPSSSIAAADSGADGLAATPYVGLGYSAWWHRTGLGVSADLGLIARHPGQLLGLINDGNSLDNTVHAMQLSPVFQINLSYSF